MATAFGSRFRRGAKAAGDERVGEMLSDSSDDGPPLGGDVRRNAAKKPTPSRSNDGSLRSSSASEGGGAVVPRSAATKAGRTKSGHSDSEKKEAAVEEKKLKKLASPKKKKTFGSLARSQSSRTTSSTKRSAGRKWYSDSDEEEEGKTKTKKEKPVKKEKSVKKSVKEEKSEDEEDSDLDAYIAGSMMDPPGNKSEELAPTPAKQARSKPKRLTDSQGRVSTGGNESDDGSGKEAPPPEPPAAHDGAKKKTNVLKLMAKTRTMSPFGGKGKGFGAGAPEALAASSPAADRKAKRGPPSSSEHSVSEAPAASNAGAGRPTEVQTGGAGNVPAIIVNRRTDRLKHSASGSEYSGSPRLANSNNDEVLSPGLRKVPGAFPGRSGSGVLLEGWLRQKQRRGIKGLKKWNSRYFVLYARSNEVRYYADVVQSAWGPIPLGEIGSISLRLIQRIGKLCHPKYKGCRFDITCRNSWGTHYADDYVSSDEENANSSNNVSTNSNIEKPAASTPAKQEKSGTPRSSRVYSLVADSPQVTVAWVNMLDSLLTRSANSPRPDVDSPAENTGATSATNASGRSKKPRPVTRQRSNVLDTESTVLLGPGELVPKAVIYAVNFIFDSTPGIETEKFYEVEPDATKLKAALKFLNEFAGDSEPRKPTKDDLEELLDAITAGAVLRLWLKQLEQPLVPFTMYEDFVALAREAQSAPFDLRRNLRALLEALPKKNLTMLACLLFHLNDVNVYSSKNGMDAAKLAQHFAEFILRPQKKSPQADNAKGDVTAVCHLVEEMITNVDTFIDEKEAQLLEDNRL
ncbi:ferric/cupric-chelate reductase [Phytophthora pseudosyringae]|uniref:Ferric/cupric-chelate reductase n=1 Tax=Phytophthora pseudosyringae TaxID=221518 RepID=A0A8T1VM40_9STRA|nr:ferric/cupric-chelate reductase [Phytophthora pseudosyringae]